MVIFVLMLSNIAKGFSCKVEFENKETIFSENCVKQENGKFLVHLCKKTQKVPY